MAGKQNVTWRKGALKMLLEIGAYIAEKSGQQKGNAFTNELIAKSNTLQENPEIYPPCRFKLLQKNNFRCMRFKSYITVYRKEKSGIIIYGIIHERRDPQHFNKLAK